MVEQMIRDKYSELLKAYVGRPAEEYLAAAADLGRELVLADVPPEDIAEIHEEALERLAREHPDITLLDAARLVSAPLMELLMAYGLAFRERLEERKRAEEAMRERQLQLSILNRMGLALAGTLELARVYRIAYEHVAQLVDCPCFGISLYDPETRTIRAEYMLSDGELLDAARFPPLVMDMEPTRGRIRAIATCRPEIIADSPAILAKAHNVTLVGAPGDERVAGSAMYVPMVVRGQVMGLLEVQSYRLNAYTSEDAALLGPVANQIGLAIENARLFEEIEKRRLYLERVLACAPDAIITLDGQHNILEWNPGAERLFGYTPQEAVGRNLGDLITGPDANVFEEAVGLTRQILAVGNVPPAEVVRYRKDGSPVDVIASGSPILIGDEVAGVVAVYTDVTEHKRMEKQLRQQERLAAVGQLAAGIAHDFNNIMATIILYAQMMLRTPEHLSSRDRERLATINHEAQHAANLTQQILDFSRRAMLKRQPLDLLPFLKELVKLLQRTLPENIQIGLAYGRDEYTVNADPTRVQQAVVNLALNARDAMPEGGELRIGLKRVRVEDGAEAPLPQMEAGEWVQVMVSDTGTGILPEVMPHLFEPFFTTKPVGQGTGLGLAQVYGIVKQHGGEIDVESQVGRGTAFTLYLPALPVSAPEGLAQELPALVEGHGETILVVEDDAGTRKALSDSLEMLNYRVLAASNGREALEVYRSVERVDLVLTDMVMPGLGGKELMRELRKMNPRVKGLAVTGYAASEELREEGIVDVFRKPFGVSTLAEVVRRALDVD